MQPRLSRRDFLKLAGLAPLSLGMPSLLRARGASQPADPGARNVLVIVFDALSALNVPLYGYARPTTPNLSRLAQRAILYRNHYASGNYTTPGTASLLTGTYPWTHRALESDTGVAIPYLTRNLFSAFPDRYRVAYTHNPWANTILAQFKPDMEDLVPWHQLFLRPYEGLIGSLFAADRDIATVAWTREVNLRDYPSAYSLFLSRLYQALRSGERADLKKMFPRGLPTIEPDDDFVLEQAIDWTREMLPKWPQPFLGYIHYLPPHEPYHTSAEFFNRFLNDGFTPLFKPEDVFTQRVAPKVLERKRREYDEFILYVDRELGRLFDSLERTGLMDSTWVVLTSDHGEMFERGQVGHGNPSLCEAVVRVPLLIFEPGRTAGMEIDALTSAVDVLPTLAHVTGHASPDWAEGQLLPPYAEQARDADQPIFAIQARHNAKYAPLTSASTMLVMGRHKLLYYFGYPERNLTELVQLYDIRADPEEMHDLAGTRRQLTDDLLGVMKGIIRKKDGPYL